MKQTNIADERDRTLSAWAGKARVGPLVDESTIEQLRPIGVAGQLSAEQRAALAAALEGLPRRLAMLEAALEGLPCGLPVQSTSGPLDLPPFEPMRIS